MQSKITNHLKKQLILKTSLCICFCALIFLSACGNKTILRQKTEQFSSKSSLNIIIDDIINHKEKIQSGKIVVYEFLDISGRNIPEGKLISERLTTRLAQTGKFNIIERTRLDAALKEMRLAFSGIIDEKTAIKAGKMLGAQAVITGTLAKIGDKFEVNVRTIDVKTGSIITGSITQIEENEIRMRREKSISYQNPKPRIIHEQIKNSSTIKSKQLRGWEEWPGWNNGYGNYKYDGKKIYQYLVSRQQDELDFPKNGYYPGLLLAKEIKGKKWTIDVKVNYILPTGSGRWFTFYIWLGNKNIRPSIHSKDLLFRLITQRSLDSGWKTDRFYMGAKYKKENTGLDIPKDVSFLKFERNGNVFKGLYSHDGKNYIEAFTTKGPNSTKNITQKIVLGGQAFNTSKSVAEYEYIKFNGKPLF